MSFLKANKRLAKFSYNKKLRLIAELIIIGASSYLMLKKLIGFSISGWLLNNVLQQPLVNVYVYASIILLILAILFKLLMIYFDYFPPSNHNAVEPDEISNCLYRINSEVSEHLLEYSKSESPNIKSVCAQHKFRVNVALAVEALAEHIRKSITNINIKKKDLFISLYEYKSDKEVLEYILHYDSKRDLVASRVITLDKNTFSKYECVKCIKSSNTTAYLLDCRGTYAKGASKRNRSVKHYMGCKIASDDRLYGFLNIEFHNNSCFADEEEMQDYMEEHIYPFKLIIEYQFMKGHFFKELSKN